MGVQLSARKKQEGDLLINEKPITTKHIKIEKPEDIPDFDYSGKFLIDPFFNTKERLYNYFSEFVDYDNKTFYMLFCEDLPPKKD